MATVTLPNTLTNGQTADASQVMGNFAAITAQVNGNIDTSNLYVPRSKLSRVASAQSLPSTTSTAITFPTLEYDVGSFGSAGSSRLTIPAGQGGTYDVRGFLVWAANSAGTRYVELRKNGATALVEQEHAPNGVAGVREALSADAVLAAGDYVELIGVQGSGGALNVTDAFLSVRKVA